MILKNKKNNTIHIFQIVDIRKYCIALLIILSTVLCITDGFAASPQALKQQELQQLRKKIKMLQKDLSRQQGEKTQLQKDIKTSEQLIAQNARRLFNSQQQAEAISKKLASLNQSVLQQNNNLFIQRQLLAEQIQASYAIGRQEYLKLLLNQQNLSSISRMMVYYQYFNEARQQQIEQVDLLLKSLQDNKQKVNLTRQQLKEKHFQLKQEKQQLDKQQQQRNMLVAKLDLDISSKAEELLNLQENEKNLTLLLKKLKRTMEETSALVVKLPEKKAFRKQRGKLIWPVKGKIKKLFGRWRSVGKVKWSGIIISAEDGTAVHSIAHGRIAYSDWLRGYGLIIIIDHGNGYMSLYGHNQTLLKEVGDWVEANEIIATVGSSGGLKKSGLYFEVRHNSKPSNPSRWCKKQRR
ncbi:MAG: peptidoglycan DD-metalloendopeptidase family protein [gamma proteobacterium symbiont of Taylorina sp.]|nr:peptidoglycan DD-metalloendopeptidase family protein [gamma proteobacterium symbiont of Taylorina sp.]